MSLTTTNLIQGPARGYYGTVGATEPLASGTMNTAPPTSSWTEWGFTDDGVTVTVENDWSEMTVDQVPDVVGYRLVKRAAKVKTNLAEASLENLKLALNGGTITTGSGVNSYEMDNNADTSARPTPKAILLDGDAPDTAQGGQLKRRSIVRKAVNVANVEYAYKRDGKKVFSVEFSSMYVSSSISPIIWNDATT